MSKRKRKAKGKGKAKRYRFGLNQSGPPAVKRAVTQNESFVVGLEWQADAMMPKGPLEPPD